MISTIKHDGEWRVYMMRLLQAKLVLSVLAIVSSSINIHVASLEYYYSTAPGIGIMVLAIVDLLVTSVFLRLLFQRVFYFVAFSFYYGVSLLGWIPMTVLAGTELPTDEHYLHLFIFALWNLCVVAAAIVQSIHGWKNRFSDTYLPPKKRFWYVLLGRTFDLEAYRAPPKPWGGASPKPWGSAPYEDKAELAPVTNLSAESTHTFRQDGVLYEIRPVQELNAASEPVELPPTQVGPAGMATRDEPVQDSKPREEV